MIENSIVNNLKNKNPFFLIIGAMDGISHDNLTPFVREMKMKGIFVEPTKYMFNKLKNNYKDFNGIFFENCAITDIDGKSIIKRIDFDNPQRYPSWSDGGSSLIPEKTAMSGVSNLIEEQISTKKLQSMLDSYDIKKIDIVQIDCEGWDFGILKQLDIKRYRPYFISIEILSMSSKEVEETNLYLKDFGFDTYNNGSEILSINKNNLE